MIYTLYMFLLMRFQPVHPFTAVGDQGNLQLDCIFHFIQYDLFYFFHFVFVDVKVQFIVYLEDHLAFQTLGFETVEDADHGHLDDIGSTAWIGALIAFRSAYPRTIALWELISGRKRLRL